VLAAWLAGCGPFLVLPGGALGGTPADAPGDWGFFDDVGTVQLETRPDDPYSVNVWAIGMGPVVYVHAGASRSAWVEHMEADPAVRLQIEGLVYSLRGERVTDQGEFDRFADAYEAKYGRRPRNENVGEAYLFRLRAP
jgi:hypothetical protein